MKKESCAGCKNDLGGGCCKIHVEAECREGGGFELWEGKEYEQPKPRTTGEIIADIFDDTPKWLWFCTLSVIGAIIMILIREWFGWKACGLAWLFGCCMSAVLLICKGEE